MSLLSMVPGPTRVHRSVREAYLAELGSSDTELAAFLVDFRRAQAHAAALLGLARPQEAVLLPGEGMLALWAGLRSVLRPGDCVVAVGGGLYGRGIGEMAARCGARVVPVAARAGGAWDLAAVAAAVRTAGDVRLVTACHCETPTGVLRAALGELGRTVRDAAADALLYVDCVSSAGGAPVDAAAAGIDLALLGSQKVVGALPNLAIVGVSERAWRCIADVDYHGYDALAPWRAVCFDGALPPFTCDWHSVRAFCVACERLLADGGLAGAHERHARVAAHCRAELRRLGLELFADDEALSSPTVTAFRVPSALDWPTLDGKLRAEGVVLGGSYGEWAGKLARIGHMGEQATRADVDRVIAALEKILKE